MADTPNMQQTVASITAPGALSSEGKMASSANLMAIIAMVLGLVTTIGGSVAESLGHDSKTAIIVGACIAIAAKIQQTLVSLGYIQARTNLKSDAADMVASMVPAAAPVTVHMPGPSAPGMTGEQYASMVKPADVKA